MVKKINMISQVKNSSREERMEQLLNQIAESFKEAFPTAEKLSRWIALTNDLIFQDGNAKDAKSAAAFTFYLGFDLLPNMITAKTDNEILQAIVEVFNDSAGTDNIAEAIPFIIGKHLKLDLEASAEADSHTETLIVLHNLQRIAVWCNEHASLRANELRKTGNKETTGQL